VGNSRYPTLLRRRENKYIFLGARTEEIWVERLADFQSILSVQVEQGEEGRKIKALETPRRRKTYRYNGRVCYGVILGMASRLDKD